MDCNLLNKLAPKCWFGSDPSGHLPIMRYPPRPMPRTPEYYLAVGLLGELGVVPTTTNIGKVLDFIKASKL